MPNNQGKHTAAFHLERRGSIGAVARSGLFLDHRTPDKEVRLKFGES